MNINQNTKKNKKNVLYNYLNGDNRTTFIAWKYEKIKILKISNHIRVRNHIKLPKLTILNKLNIF